MKRLKNGQVVEVRGPRTFISQLEDALVQATFERSHYYMGSLLKKMIRKERQRRMRTISIITVSFIIGFIVADIIQQII